MVEEVLPALCWLVVRMDEGKLGMDSGRWWDRWDEGGRRRESRRFLISGLRIGSHMSMLCS